MGKLQTVQYNILLKSTMQPDRQEVEHIRRVQIICDQYSVLFKVIQIGQSQQIEMELKFPGQRVHFKLIDTEKKSHPNIPDLFTCFDRIQEYGLFQRITIQKNDGNALLKLKKYEIGQNQQVFRLTEVKNQERIQPQKQPKLNNLISIFIIVILILSALRYFPALISIKVGQKTQTSPISLNQPIFAKIDESAQIKVENFVAQIQQQKKSEQGQVRTQSVTNQQKNSSPNKQLKVQPNEINVLQVYSSRYRQVAKFVLPSAQNKNSCLLRFSEVQVNNIILKLMCGSEVSKIVLPDWTQYFQNSYSIYLLRGHQRTIIKHLGQQEMRF